MDRSKNIFIKNGDKLVKNGNVKRDGLWGYARKPRKLSDKWDLYSIGYKKAADASIKNISRYSDFMIYPIVFLYRQYIELRLKQIITQGNSILENSSVQPNYVYTKKFETGRKDKHGNPITKTIYQIHDLTRLWKVFKDTFERLFPNDKDKLDAYEKCINQFSQIDNQADKHRFPVNTNGQLLPLPWESFSLVNLQDVMNKISLFLDGTSEVVLDMPGHGEFLPNQQKLNEEQSRDLLNSIKISEKEWTAEEIRDKIEEKYGLKYSADQAMRWMLESGMIYWVDK